MRKLLNLCIAFTLLSIASCSNDEPKNTNNTPTVPAAKEEVKVEPKIVVNGALDTVFALMVDTAKKYFPENTVAKIDWKDASAYQRDSVGNRIINIRYSIEGRMSGMSGSCVMKIEQANRDTVITQSIPYSDGSFEKNVNKLKKGEIVISVENIIFAHSKTKQKLLSNFIKVLDEQVFASGGEVFGINAQMN